MLNTSNISPIRKRIVIGIICALSIAIVVIASLYHGPNDTNLIEGNAQSNISCAWANNNDGESTVITVYNGPYDCQTLFKVNAGAGLNWYSISTGWDSGTLQCSLYENGESVKVYEHDSNSYPLVTYGNTICGDLEQVGWMPSS